MTALKPRLVVDGRRIKAWQVSGSGSRLVGVPAWAAAEEAVRCRLVVSARGVKGQVKG